MKEICENAKAVPASEDEREIGPHPASPRGGGRVKSEK